MFEQVNSDLISTKVLIKENEKLKRPCNYTTTNSNLFSVGVFLLLLDLLHFFNNNNDILVKIAEKKIQNGWSIFFSIQILTRKKRKRSKKEEEEIRTKKRSYASYFTSQGLNRT